MKYIIQKIFTVRFPSIKLYVDGIHSSWLVQPSGVNISSSNSKYFFFSNSLILTINMIWSSLQELSLEALITHCSSLIVVRIVFIHLPEKQAFNGLT